MKTVDRVGSRREKAKAIKSPLSNASRDKPDTERDSGSVEQTGNSTEIRSPRVARILRVGGDRKAVIEIVDAGEVRRLLVAESDIALVEEDEGAEVGLEWDAASPDHPRIVTRTSGKAATDAATSPDPVSTPRRVLRLEGETIVLAASSEIRLECGSASITLTKDGRIVIRGEDLLSRSSRINRIKGGSVQIN